MRFAECNSNKHIEESHNITRMSDVHGVLKQIPLVSRPWQTMRRAAGSEDIHHSLRLQIESIH